MNHEGVWLGLGFGPLGWSLSLKAGFWAPRLVFGPNHLGLEAGILASGLGFRPRGWDSGLGDMIWIRGLDLSTRAGLKD